MKRENNGKMRIIPLGGLEKIGMNIKMCIRDRIIEGVYTKDTLERLQYAAFDERLSVCLLYTSHGFYRCRNMQKC